ncbi:hypothetical protein MMC31_005257 [Peltigera leucophlebia]|nr:hypothetical protein [Peltigera leucophlebia]
MGSQPKEWVTHEAQQEATEATELQGTSQWLRVPVVVANSSVSHNSQQCSPISIIAAVKKFWRRQVIATIPENECQDHFALERTYLGYLRTSLAFSMLGVIIAQFLRLQRSENPDPNLGFFVSGIPLASICIIAAVIVLLAGTFRFWRQQNAILRGKVHAGGWEITTILVIGLMACMAPVR